MLFKNISDQITEALRSIHLSADIITTMASSDASCCISRLGRN